MKLEVGMYVRTNEGKITKLIEIDKDGFKRFDELVDFTNYEITKASHNIIDLIEPEDYVNGVEVIDKEFDNFNEEYLQCGVGDYVICTYEVKDIKSILTKEQMEQIVYRVEK